MRWLTPIILIVVLLTAACGHDPDGKDKLPLLIGIRHSVLILNRLFLNRVKLNCRNYCVIVRSRQK